MSEPEVFTTAEMVGHGSKIGHFMLHVASRPGVFESLKITPGGTFTVDLRINGVHVPVRPFIEHIFKHLDYMVEKRLTECFQERLCNLDEALNNLREGVKTAARQAFPEFKDEEY